MNKAIKLKESLQVLTHEMNEAKRQYEIAKDKTEQLKQELEKVCTHKNEDGTSAFRMNHNPMFDEWGTCQICEKYLEVY